MHDLDMNALEHAFTRAAEALAAARAAPLSARKTLLAALLVDAIADARFVAEASGGDILAFRESLAARSPALALVFAVAARRADLVTEAVTVPLADYGQLSVEDFMVSLYNRNQVQRLRIALPDGRREDVHAVLDAALADLR